MAAGRDGVAGGPNAGIVWQYTYDNHNQLVMAAKYASGVLQLQETNSYDVFGNLVEQDVTQGGSTNVTKFLYGANGNPVADLSSTNAVVARHIFLDATDAVFARIASTGAVDWELTDHLGSVRGLMNNSGGLDDAITFDPWGNIISETYPANGDRFKFAGGQWDANLVLYKFGARLFDPQTGRWITPDPLGLGPDSDPYRYVTNGPVNRTDPSGMDPRDGSGGQFGPDGGYQGKGPAPNPTPDPPIDLGGSSRFPPVDIGPITPSGPGFNDPGLPRPIWLSGPWMTPIFTFTPGLQTMCVGLVSAFP
jgi:RHS repeat-associated protein